MVVMTFNQLKTLLYSDNILDLFPLSSSTSLLRLSSQQHNSNVSTIIANQKKITTVILLGGILLFTGVGSLCWALWKNTKSRRKGQKCPDSQSTPVVLASGALPFVGHIFDLSRDSVSFIKNCKSKYGPIFRIRLPVNRELYVITEHLIPEVLNLSEQTASLYDAVESILPVEHIVYKHHEHKFIEGELNSTKYPAVPIAHRHFKGNTLYDFEERTKQAINEIFHKEELANLRSGETMKIDDIVSLMERTTSYMYSLNFYGTRSKLIDNKVLSQELIQVSRVLMRATPIYHVFPYSTADKIVRKFISAEKHLDVILRQVVPVVNGIRSGNIPDDETSYISMLMKHPVSSSPNDGQANVRSPNETALRIVRLYCTSTMGRTHINTLMLYELAYRPKLVRELREAILKLNEEPTIQTLNQIPLIDSFIREVLRLKNNTFMHFRTAKRDITLSTGHVVPEGSILTAAVNDAQQDPEMTPMFSEVPLEQFDPYRYMKIMENAHEGQWGPVDLKQPGYYTLGYGMHPCRGRYFVVQEMKLILAEVVTNYNIKPVPEKRADDRFLFGIARYPPKTPLLFERI